MGAPGVNSVSLKDYLKRYESNAEDGEKDKKKKKKVKKKLSEKVQNGIFVVDEDPVWQKAVVLEEEQDNDSADEEKPTVDEDIEVKRMRRLDQLRAKRAYNAIAEDGSGWVTLSPKHKPSEGETDLSPPRRDCKKFSSAMMDDGKLSSDQTLDLSPPRRCNKYSKTDSDDLSPPRKRKLLESGNARDEDISPPRRSRKESVVPNKQPKTGLISGREMRDEISRIKKEELSRFEKMDPSISGRGAEPIYRDKKGNRVSKEEFVKLNQKVEEKPKEKKIEWGKGLAQKRETEAKMLELELEKEKPFARTRDDPELDEMLKERVRWGDPMAHLVKKKHSELALPDLGDDARMKESGFIVPQDIPSHSWIKRGLDAAPNRYGIKPGRHWDGVDRSNGYEKQFFKRTNEKRAVESEAYLWSVSDM